jgi:hypothetical protein
LPLVLGEFSDEFTDTPFGQESGKAL